MKKIEENKEINLKIKPKLFVVSAPSGAGKSTIVAKAIEYLNRHGVPVERVITYTTKKPHDSELVKGDYHFISQDEFERKIQENFFLEWSTVYGTYYGSPRSIIAHPNCERSYILILDRLGWQALLAQNISAVSIWLEPPSLEILKERLLIRNRDSLQTIEKRLALAQLEMEQEKEEKLYRYKIVNDVLGLALQEFLIIISQELKKY